MAQAMLEQTINAGVATLTLNRPEQFNTLDRDTLTELNQALSALGKQPEVRVIRIAANGKAFCAGHDLRQLRASADDYDATCALFTLCSEVMQQLQQTPQPVIAEVQGVATAAGCQLVAACDLAVAAQEAQFAVSGVRVGLFCSTPAVALSRAVNRKRALEMLLTGDFIDAATALEYGLINATAKAEDLRAASDALAARIIRTPAAVIALGKQLFYEQLNQPQAEAYNTASQVISFNMQMAETKEGIDAFFEKRPPNWPDSPSTP